MTSELVDRILAVAEHAARSMPEQHHLGHVAESAGRYGATARATRLVSELEAGPDPQPSSLAYLHGLIGHRADVERLFALRPTWAPTDTDLFALAFEACHAPSRADDLVASMPDNRRPSMRAWLAQLATETGDFTRGAALADDNASLDTLITLAKHFRSPDFAQRAERRLSRWTITDDRAEQQVKVARMWLAIDRKADALRLAKLAEKQQKSSYPNHWHGDLARLLVELGETTRGEKMARELLRKLKNVRTAEGRASYALELARFGRDDGVFDAASARAEALRLLPEAVSQRTVLRDLVEASLLLDDVPKALKLAQQIDDPLGGKLSALDSIARYCREHRTELTPEIEQALTAPA